MDLNQDFVANELAEIIEAEMRAAGMNTRRQVGRQKGPVTSRKLVDGVIIIWNSINGKSYDKRSFMYRIVTVQDSNSSISGSIFGPYRHNFARDQPKGELIERIEQKLETIGYIFYRRWGPLAEYRPVTN